MIARIWIEDGCISCSLCQDVCPDVFEVRDGETCVVRPGAAANFRALDDEIRLAAEDCPVEVIQIEEASVTALADDQPGRGRPIRERPPR